MDATSSFAPDRSAGPSFRTIVLIYLLWQLLILAFLAATPTSVAGQGQRYHVSTGGSDSFDGSAWTAAFQTLNRALDAAGPGDEIWMETGLYFPIAPAGRNATFRLESGVKIHGGFLGTESILSERDCSPSHETILSGALGEPGKAYHVVSAVGVDADALLECVVIQDGAAADAGGGLHAVDSEIQLDNVVFRNNTAAGCGGGMFHDGGSVTRLTDVTFKWNSAAMGGGFCNESGDPVLIRTRFDGNFAPSGGGMYNKTGIATLDDVHFTSNGATHGGGLNGQGPGVITVTNSSFSRNYANSFGGGIFNQGTLYVEGTSFSSNTVRTSTTGGGGGLFNSGTGVARVARSVFTRNDANSRNSRGGAVYQGSGGTSQLHLWNALIAENDAGNGGGVFILDGLARFVNVTISENDAREEGGAFFLLGGRTDLSNSILWNNRANYDPEILLLLGKLNVNTSIIPGGCRGSFTTCLNVMDTDPLLDPGYALDPLSPAVDAGEVGLYDVPVSLITGTHVDLAGNARVGGATIDLGAFEQWPEDADGDGIANDDDVCPGTTDDVVASPRPNHWYLADGQFVQVPPGFGSDVAYTTVDTRGCSCAQIVAELGLGKGSLKSGCSNGVMDWWVNGQAGKQDRPTDPVLPRNIELAPNYPNPFNPETVIRFAVPDRAHVRLVVYDLLGREVRVLLDGPVDAGDHEANFDADGLSSGGYIYRLTTSGGTYSRLMTLLR